MKGLDNKCCGCKKETRCSCKCEQKEVQNPRVLARIPLPKFRKVISTPLKVPSVYGNELCTDCYSDAVVEASGWLNTNVFRCQKDDDGDFTGRVEEQYIRYLDGNVDIRWIMVDSGYEGIFDIEACKKTVKMVELELDIACN